MDVFSVNAPVPGRVAALADSVAPALGGIDSIRGEHTLVVKRFEANAYTRLEKRVRRALEGTPSMQARVTGVDAFREPARGPAPVVYLVVESPGLRDLHARLVDDFGAIDGLEGPAYVPHVTLGRGGDPDLDALRSLDVEPVSWTVTALELYDGRRREAAARFPLPR